MTGQPLSGTSGASPEQRRWTLNRLPDEFDADEMRWQFPTTAHPPLAPGDEVEVMPVEEHERLMAEMDFFIKHPPTPPSQAALDIAAKREIEQLRAELAALREAAQAVADQFVDIDSLRHPDNSTCPHRLRAGSVRALRAVLDASTTKEER